MTHQEEYDKIINFRKSNLLPKDQYGEKHHIVPKSICPLLKNAPDNIIRLSAQEHFLAHYHLWLAYRDELKDKTWAKKMCYAFYRMKQQLLKCDDVESMAKLYEEVRIEQAKSENNPFFGKHQSEEVKQKLRKPRSEEIKKKISKSLKGKNNPMFGKCSNDNPNYGKHWFNNGVTNIRAKECPDGFVHGMLFRQK